MQCGYSYPGTFGHECGAVATVVGIRTDCKLTTDGIYFAFRCADCQKLKAGQDNAGIKTWEPIDPTKTYENKWNGRYA